MIVAEHQGGSRSGTTRGDPRRTPYVRESFPQNQGGHQWAGRAFASAARTASVYAPLPLVNSL